MKVLMSTDNIGGVWTYTLNLAEGLRNRGIDVFIAVTGNVLTTEQQYMIKSFSYEVIPTRQEWMSNPWEDIEKTTNRLNILSKLIHPDVIHLNSFSYNSQEWGKPVIVVAHSCVISWWNEVFNESPPSEWSSYIKKVSFGINNADVVVAPSYTMLNYVKKYYSPVAATVIYNGLNSEDYYTSEKESFVFSMGRLWDKAKNISLLIDASVNIDSQIYIAGEMISDDMNSVIPPNVHFTGFLNPSQTRDYLSRAAVYALPVKYEPFGYTFLEAALSECALVTGDIQSMREIWADTALFSDTGDSMMLAERINLLLHDSALCKKNAALARSKAIKLYNIDKMANSYVNLYSKLRRSFRHKNVNMEVE